MSVYTYRSNRRPSDPIDYFNIPSSGKRVNLGGWGELTELDVQWASTRFILEPGKTGYDRTRNGRRRDILLELEQGVVQLVAAPNPSRVSLTVQAVGANVYLGASNVSPSNYNYMIMDGGTATVPDDEADYYACADESPCMLSGVEVSS